MTQLLLWTGHLVSEEPRLKEPVHVLSFWYFCHFLHNCERLFFVYFTLEVQIIYFVFVSFLSLYSSRPLYFPTLYQISVELERAVLTSNHRVRVPMGADRDVFPSFSGTGYAIFPAYKVLLPRLTRSFYFLGQLKATLSRGRGFIGIVNSYFTNNALP